MYFQFFTFYSERGLLSVSSKFLTKSLVLCVIERWHERNQSMKKSKNNTELIQKEERIDTVEEH